MYCYPKPMEPCYDVIEATAAIAEEHYPFGVVPLPKTCIRLGTVPLSLMARVCANNGLVITKIEQRHFPDGDDTVIIVQPVV